MGRSGDVLKRLGGILGRLGGVLEASWGCLEASWGRLGRDLGLQDRPKPNKKSIQKSIIFLIGVKMDLSWIVGGFWRYLGFKNQ